VDTYENILTSMEICQALAGRARREPPMEGFNVSAGGTRVEL